jgi:hypothetical protein
MDFVIKGVIKDIILRFQCITRFNLTLPILRLILLISGLFGFLNMPKRHLGTQTNIFQFEFVVLIVIY